MVLHLYEVDSRKIYHDKGYASLFSYCREALRYSEGAAFRRIQAARALKDNPEIYELLKEGKLSLCAVAEISKVIKPENKEVLLTESQGKAKLEVQKITAKYGAPTVSRKERITPRVTKSEALPIFSHKNEIKQEFMDLLEKAKVHMGPIPLAEVFRKTLKSYLNQKEKKPQVRKVKNNKNLTSRYIPKAVKHEVSVRDNQCCSFVGSDGKRCTEKMRLQVDHIRPYALGGDSSLDNLRLLCPSHNLLMAERSFGKDKINSYF